jgi:hypothetical protein
MLFEQQAGDEKPGQNEKDVNPEEAPRKELDIRGHKEHKVVEKHKKDRHPPQSIKRWTASQFPGFNRHHLSVTSNAPSAFRRDAPRTTRSMCGTSYDFCTWHSPTRVPRSVDQGTVDVTSPSWQGAECTSA